MCFLKYRCWKRPAGYLTIEAQVLWAFAVSDEGLPRLFSERIS